MIVASWPDSAMRPIAEAYFVLRMTVNQISEQTGFSPVEIESILTHYESEYVPRTDERRFNDAMRDLWAALLKPIEPFLFRLLGTMESVLSRVHRRSC